MKNTTSFALISAISLMGIAAGCGTKVTVKSDDGKSSATVDIGTNSANMNINGTSVSTGNSVSLPSDFPADIYLINSSLKTAVSTPHVSDTISMTTTSTPADAFAAYKQHLASDGWTITMSAQIDAHSAEVLATKNSRSLTVSISDDTPPTIVQISVMFGSSTNSNSSTNASAE